MPQGDGVALLYAGQGRLLLRGGAQLQEEKALERLSHQALEHYIVVVVAAAAAAVVVVMVVMVLEVVAADSFLRQRLDAGVRVLLLLIRIASGQGLSNLGGPRER